MTKSDELLALAERVERYEVSGPYDIAREREREINEAIAIAAGLPATIEVGHEVLGNYRRVPYRIPAYTASLDAAMTLVPEGLSFEVRSSGIGDSGQATVWDPMTQPGLSSHKNWRITGCATPALALTAAALRARASMEGEG